jgi:hypothetical protein
MLEKELEKQGQFASRNRSDRGNGVPLVGGHRSWKARLLIPSRSGWRR